MFLLSWIGICPFLTLPDLDRAIVVANTNDIKCSRERGLVDLER